MAARAFLSRLPRGLLPWMLLSAVFFIGCVITLISVIHVPKAESLRANSNGQRVIIDPATGIVAGLAKKTAEDKEPETEAPKPDEDSASAEEKPTDDKTAAEKPSEEKLSEEKPASASPANAETPATDAKPAETTEQKPANTPEPQTPPEKPPVTTGEKLTPSTAPKLATQPTNTEIPPITAGAGSIVAPGALEITEKINGQPVPKTNENGLKASALYAKRFTPAEDKAEISIVVTDAGFNAQSMALILKLPREVTIAFSPYATDSTSNITKLHAAGFETWGMLPSMGAHYPQNDPGPLGLIASLPPEENMRRLRATMSNTIGAVGLILQPDESLSLHAKAYTPMISDIIGRGLYVLSTHPTHSVESVAGGDKTLLPSIRRADVLLDGNAPAAEIQSKLDGLKALAEKQRNVIVIAPARPQMLILLADWLSHNGLGAKAELAPLSVLYKPAKVDAPPADEKKDAEKKPEGEKEEKKPEAEKKPDAKPAPEKEHGSH